MLAAYFKDPMKVHPLDQLDYSRGRLDDLEAVSRTKVHRHGSHAAPGTYFVGIVHYLESALEPWLWVWPRGEISGAWHAARTAIEPEGSAKPDTLKVRFSIRHPRYRVRSRFIDDGGGLSPAYD
jgi:hypothetical protein